MKNPLTSFEDAAVWLICRKCSETIEWGQDVCPSCGAKTESGLPKTVDLPLGFLFYLVFLFVVFLIASWVSNALESRLPIELRLLLAAIVTTKLVHSFGLGVYPRASRLRLVVSRGPESTAQHDERPFDFEVSSEDWRNKPQQAGTLDYILRGIRLESEMARFCGSLPAATVIDRLETLSRSTSTAARTEALRSMVRLGDRRLIPRMKELISDSDVDRKVRKEAQRTVEKIESC